jgi:hypothetical protein
MFLVFVYEAAVEVDRFLRQLILPLPEVPFVPLPGHQFALGLFRDPESNKENDTFVVFIYRSILLFSVCYL